MPLASNLQGQQATRHRLPMSYCSRMQCPHQVSAHVALSLKVVPGSVLLALRKCETLSAAVTWFITYFVWPLMSLNKPMKGISLIIVSMDFLNFFVSHSVPLCFFVKGGKVCDLCTSMHIATSTVIDAVKRSEIT
eukprot:GHUV01048540.1.p1 GENE.GHUV01048540.1~~GHUV01048540.1.p1  ORF type:complete len:135 (+),score=8.61 GHUV01048540.1:660-1064(+)